MNEDEDPLAHASAAALLAALVDADYATRVRAACAVGDQLRFKKMNLSPALRDELAALVRGKSEEAKNEWDDLRFEAAIALSEAKDPSAALLGEALGDARRRFDSLKALSRLSPDPVLNAKVERVFEKWFLYWPDRLAAAATLAQWGEARGAAFFDKTLAFTGAPYRRALAIYLLGDLRMANAFSRLTAIAQDDSDPARGAAIRALGHLHDPRGLDFLQREWTAYLQEDVDYARALLT